MNLTVLRHTASLLLLVASTTRAGLADGVPSRIDRLRTPSPAPSDVGLTFPTTAVGSTSTIHCEGFCFRQLTSPEGSCDAANTATLDHAPAAPFAAFNFRKGSASGCGGTPVSLPVSLNAGEAVWFDLNFSPTSNGTFTDALTLTAFSFDLSGSTPNAGGGCVANATTLCIDQNPGDGRFQIQVNYSTAQGGGLAGAGDAIGLSSLGVTEGGLFWFFASNNPEMLIKIIDGCALNSSFWVFYAATTNVGFTVIVTDTFTGNQATYHNQDESAAPPVQDTGALPCP